MIAERTMAGKIKFIPKHARIDALHSIISPALTLSAAVRVALNDWATAFQQGERLTREALQNYADSYEMCINEAGGERHALRFGPDQFAQVNLLGAWVETQEVSVPFLKRGDIYNAPVIMVMALERYAAKTGK